MSAAQVAAVEVGARRAVAVIRGQTAAERVLRSLVDGTAAPDALAEAWAGLRSDRHAMKGFARTLQTALERGAAREGAAP